MNTDAPSGAQLRIVHGDHAATITEVGAAVREYAVGGRPVFVPFGVDEISPAFNGAVLLPWPNRLRDGRYEVDGTELQLPVTEPTRGTALHGLAAWQRWSVVARTAAAVTLELRLVPTPGYPFALVSRVTYALDDDGLRVHVRTENTGRGTAPYGVGFHPWLSPAGADLDDCTIRLDAASRVTTDERLLPTGTEPVAGAFDLRETRSLRGVDLDDAFVDVLRDEDGLSWVRVGAPDGRTTAVWMDASMDTWQVCTGDHVGDVAFRRTGVAAEPMSCVADAFRTGDRLVRLAPGAAHEVTWGATLL
ncbi:aldose 1-epimerase family protein [Cellulosimicrobium marinum]|uniref:aldose 1-epimerase family protein n=1 Tax=Cellulosimicrobium marinum TaxID=1638992 RepID=UPI001E3FF8DB|nr:aldose 1-epimerase family protein [Cellulosimicrobium marinum]MCB7138082.1 aldose 1-epimerase family protein [Cellulosimicrobium marinum]